jgi:hypothetical protein
VIVMVELRNVLVVVILFVTFTLGPTVFKLTILPALGLLLPYALKI